VPRVEGRRSRRLGDRGARRAWRPVGDPTAREARTRRSPGRPRRRGGRGARLDRRPRARGEGGAGGGQERRRGRTATGATGAEEEVTKAGSAVERTLSAEEAAVLETSVVPRYLSMFGERLLGMIAASPDARVCHVACRTGYPDGALLERLPNAHLHGCDASE